MDAMDYEKKAMISIKLRKYLLWVFILIFVSTSFYVFQISKPLFQFTRIFYVILLSFPLTAAMFGLRIFSKTKIYWIFFASLCGIIPLFAQTNRFLRDVEISDSFTFLTDITILINGVSLSLSIAFALFEYFEKDLEKMAKTLCKSDPSEKEENL